MPKNIFDFEDAKEKVSEEKSTANEKPNPQKTAEELINHYQGYSQQDLIGELFKVASVEKEKGTLTKERLDDIKATILPYLNENQIAFLDKLIEKLNV